MVNIVNSYHAVVIFFIILKTVFSDLSVGSHCEFGSSGAPGVCKLLIHCRKVRDDLIKNHELPQTCGFQETQPIVCCPRNGSEKTIPGEISKRMCRTYSRYAFGNETSNTKNECGHTTDKKVVAVRASDKEFPHMALIGKEKKGIVVWYCGGTIISELYVLTAAKCISSFYGPAKYVKIGVADPTRSEYKQEFKVAETIVHPDYDKGRFYNDIALIKLEKPANLNAFARPACLYTKPEILEEKPIAIGWNTTTFAGSSSKQLLKVTLNFVDYKICNNTYYYKPDPTSDRLNPGVLKESQICTGGEGADACQGRFGDPLQIYHTGDDIMCMYDIVGISSFRNFCVGPSSGVFTRVSHYIQWIENTVWPSEL